MKHKFDPTKLRWAISITFYRDGKIIIQCLSFFITTCGKIRALTCPRRRSFSSHEGKNRGIEKLEHQGCDSLADRGLGDGEVRAKIT